MATPLCCGQPMVLAPRAMRVGEDFPHTIHEIHWRTIMGYALPPIEFFDVICGNCGTLHTADFELSWEHLPTVYIRPKE